MNSLNVLDVNRSFVWLPSDLRSAEGVLAPHKSHHLMPVLSQRTHQRLADEPMRPTHENFHFAEHTTSTKFCLKFFG